MNIQEELISIIIPIYNVEKYLSKCIDSIINQTYQKIEIILVDDGSPDSCPNICDAYALKDSRIKVIHKKNGGLSDARNEGIKIASGKYIGFVDSDDFINHNLYEVLYNNLISNDSDISICKFKKVIENEEINNINCDVINQKISVYNNLEAINNLYNNDLNVETVVAWNKLYKKELWNNINYPFGKLHEDEFVIHKLLYFSNKVVYSDMELYYYLQRESGITGTFNIRRLDALEALKDRIDFLKNKNLFEFYVKSLYGYFFTLIDIKNKIGKNNKEAKKIIKKEMSISFKKILKEKRVSFFRKTKLIFFYIFK